MPVFVRVSVKHILKHHSSWVEHFFFFFSLWSILDHIQSALWYEDSPWWLSWRLADKTMYILFYPLKFPSTPVLIPFKVLQHHNNLLWPRQDSNLHSPIGIMTTSRPVFILESNLWQFATLFILTVRLLILHTSLLSRVTLPFVYKVIW